MRNNVELMYCFRMPGGCLQRLYWKTKETRLPATCGLSESSCGKFILWPACQCRIRPTRWSSRGSGWVTLSYPTPLDAPLKYGASSRNVEISNPLQGPAFPTSFWLWTACPPMWLFSLYISWGVFHFPTISCYLSYLHE